ncbi:hypothetical protein C8F01DRAFT_1342069 [Mycena amicta]|nr:hypothetical protein C8F01DRAFT_1342069 [Mycena amicta]
MPAKRAKRASASPTCLTLLEDEMTRCGAPAVGDRCLVHTGQYQKMTRAYKEAQKFVDSTFDATLPTKDAISAETSIPILLDKARTMKEYVNAIRKERTGRELHHKRFFLKVDDGHKRRLKILERRMVEGVEIRDAIETRAMWLHLQAHPAKEWAFEFQQSLDAEPTTSKQFDAAINFADKTAQHSVAASPDDDLVALAMRRDRERVLFVFDIILNPDKFTESVIAAGKRSALDDPVQEATFRKNSANIMNQYLRRIVFHSPRLLALALDKVSVRDLLMDDGFGMEEVMEIAMMVAQRLRFGLEWWKDAISEAFAMSANDYAPANMGTLENRFKILGGWIFNNIRNKPASNKVWWYLLMSDPPEPDTENRYVRICSSFDELQTFMTINALAISFNQPSFCKRYARTNTDPPDSSITRNHLTLSGFIVADLIHGPPSLNTGPIPTGKPAKTPGCVMWAEAQFRPYMFGIIHPDDTTFNEAFLRELCRCPEKFIVISRRDSDPPMKLDVLSEPTSCSAADVSQTRFRTFEAPFAMAHNRPAGRGEWQTMRSAMHVIYGGEDLGKGQTPAPDQGYLAIEFNNTKGQNGRSEVSMFYHKNFPVRYLLILGTDPMQHVHDLAREVAWAAFKAHGLVMGKYDRHRYERASDVLFTKEARERMAFMPEGSFQVKTLT